MVWKTLARHLATTPAAGHAETTAPGSGAEAHVDTSYTGDLGATSYTVGDIVNALKQLGLLTQ